MSTGWMIYWWTRLDQIQNLFAIIIVVTALVALFSAILYIANQGEYRDEKTLKDISSKSLKWSGSIFFIACFFSIWIPNSKDMALIVGGQVATNIVQTPEAQELGSKALKLINNELDNRINKSTKKDK